MKKLLNLSLRKFAVYAGIVLVCSIPVYYAAIDRLWKYELDEHNIILSPEAAREDRFLIIGAVTTLTVIFFALLLIGFIILNRRISKRLWRPFYNSLEKIKRFDLNAQDAVTFDKTEIAEFSELNNSLDKLISGNIAAYKQQKEFADNASHELQTPLAIVQSKLEILLQNQSLTTEQYNITEEALKALARVGRINKNLLLLTKIENSQFAESETIDLTAVLENTLASLAVFSETKLLEMQKNIQPDVIIKGNRILIEILLNNLLVNAIRYSPNQSTCSINLSPSSLNISNAGNKSLKVEQLFRRFSSASPDSPGTGLGLALVYEICKRYNWAIEYNFSNDQHHFSLRF